MKDSPFDQKTGNISLDALFEDERNNSRIQAAGEIL